MANTQITSADSFERCLRRNVVEAWFSRCADDQYGGFICDFSQNWTHQGSPEKLLEFQSRQTMVAAEAAQAFPDVTWLPDLALKGFTFLRDVMWDKTHGGWFHRVTRDGIPVQRSTKHVHGMAYALQACATVHALTGEESALRLGKDAFAWLERHAHDGEHGGYWSFLNHKGQTITRVGSDWDQPLDPIGTPIGFKDMNVMSDLLEGLCALYMQWPDPVLRQRIATLTDIVVNKLLSHDGAVYFLASRDWRPVQHSVMIGNQMQTALRLVWAASCIGRGGLHIEDCLKLTDAAVRLGWDEDEGAFYYATPGSPVTSVEAQDMVMRKKAWWVQVEALKTLLAASQLAPHRRDLFEKFERLNSFIEREIVDHQYGGSRPEPVKPSPSFRALLRGARRPEFDTRKGYVWKDASHEGRSWLTCMHLMRPGARKAIERGPLFAFDPGVEGGLSENQAPAGPSRSAVR